MIKEDHDMSKADREAHVALNGGFNDYPPKWREINADTFAKSRHFAFAPVLREYRQMYHPEGKWNEALSARLEWQFDGTGYAVVNDYWKGTVKFYTFGEQPAGYVEKFDSSD